MSVFSVLVGMTFLVFVYSHFTLFRDQIRKIAVDKIIPECFRGCRYGACDYYKEFYNPSHHQTPKPFLSDIKGRKIERLYEIKRDDYDNTQWNVKWQGKTLKTKGKVFSEESEVAVFKKLPSSDDSRIAETVTGDLPSISQKHEQKHSILEKDFSTYIDGETI